MFAARSLIQNIMRLPAHLLMPVCLLLVNTSSIWAQNADETWLIRISEKEMQLAYEDVPEAMKPIMWDVTDERNNYYRNMPTLELLNVAPAGSPDIVQLALTIGDTRFHFGDNNFSGGASQCPCHPSLIAIANGGTVDPRVRLTTPGITVTPTLSDAGNTLMLEITKAGGGGLAPGELLRFQIEIEADTGFSHPALTDTPDFRTVMFDMNAGGAAAPVQVYGPDPFFAPGAEDNSQATILFGNGLTGGPAIFTDQTINGPQSQFFNANYRPYGIMEPVDIFETGGFVIPEPSSALLGVGGLLGGAWLSGRSRRTTRPM